MLNVMREHAGSWMIKVILIAIVIVFVFWGVGDFNSRKASRVASVNGEPINMTAYQHAYNALIEQYRQQFGTGLDENMLALFRVKEQALEQVINRTILMQEAQKLGLVVSDAEISISIRNMPHFQTNGVFDSNRYHAILSQNHLTAEDFEMDHRDSLLIDKLTQLISGAAKVSDEEVREWHNWQNAMVNIDYVRFSNDTGDDPEISPEALAEYFEAHKKNYQIPSKRKVRYVRFGPGAYSLGVTVSEAEIADYYESRPELFNIEKQVEARHILIAVDAGTNAEEAEKKATDISKRAKNKEDFAELATLFSDCPSKTKGGHLGFFMRGEMVKPFSDAAFSMTPGEISDPVKTEFGWHVIKVESVKEAVTQSLDQSRKQIVETLTHAEAQRLAHENAERFYADLYETDDFLKQAAAANLTVHETDSFTQKEGPAELGNDRKAIAAVAFELNPGEISDLREINGRYYVIQTIEAMASVIPSLDAVHEAVTADLKKKIRRNQAKASAEAMAADLRAGKSFADSANTHGATIIQTGLFKRDADISGIGRDFAFIRAAFELQPNAPTRSTPVEGSTGFYLLHLTERRLPAADALDEKGRTQLVNQLLQQKKRAAFQAWMAARRAESHVVVEKNAI